MSLSTMVDLYIALLIIMVFLDKAKALDLKFQQKDYKVEFEHLEVASFNKPYTEFYKATTFKYNRTCPPVNTTFQYNVDVGNDLEMITQAHVFLSNEYRQFPLRLEVNLCEALSKNYAGVTGFTKCGNFTGCPIKKKYVTANSVCIAVSVKISLNVTQGRVYHFCNWAPDPSQLPPFMPNGRYMLEIQGLFHDIELYVVRVYGRIYRPIPIPDK